MSDYKPGTVAVATVRGIPNVRVFRREDDWTSAGVTGSWVGHGDKDVTDVRPRVVLDPDDIPPLRDYLPESIQDYDADDHRLAALIAEIEAQTKPKPEVYEHLTVSVAPSAVVVALCGKVWEPGQDVTVVGRCPECVEVAELGWTA